MFPNLSKSQSNLSRQINVHVRVSGIESWRCQVISSTEIPILRYAKSRLNRSRWIKIRSGPLIQLHIGVSRIATWRGKRNNATRIAKSRFNRSHWINVWSGPLILVHFGVSRIESWRGQRIITTGILKSRYVILWFNRSRQIKMWSGPSTRLTSAYHVS